MSSITFNDLDKLDKDLNKILKEFPDVRRELHEEFADIIKTRVDREIQGSLSKGANKIQSWQKKYVGSKGGYAAVRPIDTSVGANSPGAITNYLESGHKIRRPSGKAKRYRPRVNKIYVNGFRFYSKAIRGLENEVIKVTEDFVEKLLKEVDI